MFRTTTRQIISPLSLGLSLMIVLNGLPAFSFEPTQSSPVGTEESRLPRLNVVNDTMDFAGTASGITQVSPELKAPITDTTQQTADNVNVDTANQDLADNSNSDINKRSKLIATSDLNPGDLTGSDQVVGFGDSTPITITGPKQEYGARGSLLDRDNEYVLGPGDVLNVVDLGGGDDAATQNVPIAPDGTVNIYPVGVVKAAGQTADQLSKQLNQLAQKYVVEPQYSVSISKVRPVVVYVLGQVKNPGIYQFSEGSLGGGYRPSDPSQVGLDSSALRNLVGGGGGKTGPNILNNFANALSPFAALGGAGGATGGVAGGGLSDAVQAQASQLHQLLGDSATGSFQRSGVAFSSNTSTLSVLAAIDKAGGLKDDANIRQIRVHRPLTGKTYYVNLHKLLIDGDTAQDVVIQAGDSIFVPKGGGVFDPNDLGVLAAHHTRRVRVLGNVSAPGLYELKPEDDVYSIIAKAGGFTKIAKQRTITLSRKQRDGSVKVFKVSTKKTLRDANYIGRNQIQSGDIVMVGTSATRYMLPGTIKTIGVLIGGIVLIWVAKKIQSSDVRTGQDANNSNVRVIAF